jgi:pyruvate dehydrogenase E2 component (dihydrolipoamide acetyltransferase)
MAHVVTMPRYGANMEEGIIGEWMVAQGDQLAAGTVVCSVEIEKLTNEVETPVTGVVRAIMVDAGYSALCGAPLCIIGDANEDISEYLSGDGAEQVNETIVLKESHDDKIIDRTSIEGIVVPSDNRMLSVETGRRPITPKALQLAKQLSVSWAGLQGTGRLGMITREDIRRAKAAGNRSVESAPQVITTSPTKEFSKVKLSGSRKITAERMMESVHASAQAAIWMDADITCLMHDYNHKRETWKQEGVSLSMTALLVKALSSVLVEHPECRTQLDVDGNLVLVEHIDIAIAVDTLHGLLVPIVRQANTKTLREIAVEITSLAQRARVGALSPDEMRGQAMTISNLGMYGVTYMRPILNTPESVILGVGKVQRVPVYKGDGLFPCDMLPLSLSFDHRLIDGGPAAVFLRDVCDALSNLTVE